MEEVKRCFKCGLTLPLAEFYKHAKMGDGHLNKCKDCAKKDVKDKYDENVLKPGYIEKERTRGRKKYHRLYVGTGKANTEANAKWAQKYPEKEAVRRLNIKRLTPKGFEGHHWSYNTKHQKDVIALIKKHHMKAHRFIIYDQERFMYRRYDTNELLDTKEKHEQFIRWCIDTKED
jgi:hypothetical protein